ncbi:MAG TPA: ROK family protein [Pseudogracilibacillus sp.]|nr:ROK family protein [Pseudogracilibacillus sp.]
MTPLGIDIGGSSMTLLVEHEGEKFSKTIHTGKAYTPDDIKKEMIQFIQPLPFNIDCIGVAVPGLVDRNQSVVTSDVLPHISGMDADFLKINKIATYLINDVKAALIQETYANKQMDTIVIMVGTGIAAGMMQNGIYTNGSKGWAGELGSIPISIGNNIKSLDELASGASILARLDTDARTLNQLLEKNDTHAHQIVESAGGYLGLGIATMINLFNPEKIILGGGTIQYEGYVDAALDAAEKHTLPALWNACTITKSENPKEMVARGAMHYALLKGMI